MTSKLCPRCGSRNFQICDCYATTYIYEVEDGVVHAEGIGDSADHVRTTCVCRTCNHV